jgi:LuxR family maltose regulon positive regulatory protein
LAAHFADPGAAEEDPALYAQWLALRAMLRNAVGQPTEALALANQALEIVPVHEDYARCQVLLEIASAHQQMGESAAAREAYEQVMQQGRASDNLVFELLAIAALSLIAVERGELFTAFEMTSRGIARMEDADLLPPISTALYGELGQVCYQWHQLDEAQRYFRRATEVSTLSGFSDAEIYHAVILSRLHQIEGDLTAAAGEIQRAVDLMRVEAPAAVRDEVTAQRIRVYLAQGQVTRAERLLDEITRSGPSQSTARQAADGTNFAYYHRLLRISKLRILLAKGRDRGDGESLTWGVAEATILMEMAAQRHYMPVVLETLLLRAQMYAAMGERERALADTRRALELAEPENAITLFVEHGPVIAGHLQALLVRGELGPVQPDYVRRILDTFGSGDERWANPGDTDAPLIEALTDRELEVLQLISQGLTYQQTADRLYVSLNTIRTHVKAIYGKLGVNNKTQAIEEAGRLHLL